MGKVIYYPPKKTGLGVDFNQDFSDDSDIVLSSLMIKSEANVAAGDYQVPQLTAEQVTNAHNAVVSGRGATIVDKDGVGHFVVNQADSLNDKVSIEIVFYKYMLLTYTLEGNNVTLSTKAL